MASRNMYDIEDVACTLLYAARAADQTLAHYALAELYASQEHELAFRILTFAWMLCEPRVDACQAQRMAAWCATDCAALLATFTTPQHALPPYDMPGPEPPHATTTAQLGTVKWLPPPNWTATQAAVVLRTVERSLRKHYWEHASYVLRPLLSSSATQLLVALGVPSAFTDMMNGTVFSPLCERMCSHALAWLCCPPAPPPLPRRIPAATTRAFTISPQAMAEWHIRPKHLTVLRGAPVAVCDADASAYWRAKVATYACRKHGDSLVFEDPTKTEEFYVHCFPNDIPDEWTEAECLKSHGFAVDDSRGEKNIWQAAFMLCFA